MIELPFNPGLCVVTPGADAAIKELGIEPGFFVHLHTCGNFGSAGNYDEIVSTITEEEYKEGPLATDDSGKLNVIALSRMSGRVMSFYKVDEVEIWVSTDGLESPERYTTVLLPSDY